MTTALVLLVAVAAMSRSPERALELDRAVKPSTPLAGEGSCDVDGVDISYQTTYVSTAAPAGYRVTGATVTDIADPSCNGAELRVDLLDGTTVRASATEIVGTEPTASVTFTAPALAEEVDNVHVELAGGEVPIPQQCRPMRLDRVRVGTTGDDVIPGSNDRDLVFGLGGDDRIDGGNLGDCLDGGDGADRLDGGTSDDILVGGPGNDTLIGGEGKDELYGGDGDDVLTGAQGNDRLDGGPGHDRCSGGQGTNHFTSCEVIVP
jgi:Ca2+-binding RTX toxin-like protein